MVIRAQIPYIRQEIPIMIVFRALGFVPDKDILVFAVCRVLCCAVVCCAVLMGCVKEGMRWDELLFCYFSPHTTLSHLTSAL